MHYPLPLCGRIEITRITRVYDASPSIGLVQGQEVKVNHAPTPEGESCLVRINMRSIDKEVYGNFITSKISENFPEQGLGLEQYALVALWEQRMFKERRYPSFEEIKQYYRPGNLGQVYYFSAENVKRRRVLISKTGVDSSGRSYRKVVYAFRPHGGVSLLMTETNSLLEDICTAFQERNMMPIVMEARC